MSRSSIVEVKIVKYHFRAGAQDQGSVNQIPTAVPNLESEATETKKQRRHLLPF